MGAKLDKIRAMKAKTVIEQVPSAFPTVMVSEPMPTIERPLVVVQPAEIAEHPPQPEPTPTTHTVPPKQKGQRLPDLAEFHVTFSAAKLRWTGTLIIPGCPVFEGCHGGVFGLLGRLDKQFRAWEKREGK